MVPAQEGSSVVRRAIRALALDGLRYVALHSLFGAQASIGVSPTWSQCFAHGVFEVALQPWWNDEYVTAGCVLA